jgi:urease accessory protein
MSARLAGLLSVLQLSDSAFPSGRYTLSHGLEAFAQSGELGGAGGRSGPGGLGRPARPGEAAGAVRPSELLALLGDCARHGVGPSDGVALACAHRAVGPHGVLDLDLVTRADRRLTAVKLAREVREASTRTGRALMAVTGGFGTAAVARYAEHVAGGHTPGNHAVALGVLCAGLEVPRVEAVAGELYAFAAGWVAAAVRLALLDHRTAQRLLHRVRPVLAEAAEAAVERDVADIAGCTPLVDVMSMRHEQAELRLFAS